jgi:hypothetical protein
MYKANNLKAVLKKKVVKFIFLILLLKVALFLPLKLCKEDFD